MMKSEEDRISDLPDAIIHHILSFLPSTKQAIQTGLLSKQWRYQWTHIPVLIFDSTGMSFKKFLYFIEATLVLHDCSKIKKFHLNYDYLYENDPQFTKKIRLATRKYVEDLYLRSNLQVNYMLPKFLFNNGSLVKLSTESCNFPPDFGEVNWRNLKSLSVSHCRLPLSDQGLERILSGSPLLESLELNNCYGFKKLVIASKSLKKLVLDRLETPEVSFFEISCPKLEELSLLCMSMLAEVFVRAIENVVSGCSLLESFELIYSNKVERLVIASESLKRLVLEDISSAFDIEISCPKLENLKISRCLNVKTAKLITGCSLLESFELIYSNKVERLVIASESLKRLVLEDISCAFDIEISCPKLENLKISRCLNVKTAKLINLSSLLCATIDFYGHSELKNHKSVVKEILQQLHHIKELRIGRWFVEILSDMKVKGLFSRVNIKSLTVNAPDLNKHYSAIACLLRNSPELENLVVDLTTNDQKLNDSWENFFNSNTTYFGCLESHLETIMIVNFPKGDGKHASFLKLVQFLLKNAKVLEKVVFTLRNQENFPLKAHRKLLSFPRWSQHAVIEFVML